MYPHSPYVCVASSRLGYLQNPYDKALVGYSPHQCRRAYAGAAAHVLKNPYLMKALLAHAISDVTEMYVVVDFEQKVEAAALVADSLMMKLTGSPPAPVSCYSGKATRRSNLAQRGAGVRAIRLACDATQFGLLRASNSQTRAYV
jgi:hypothetical protein